MTSTHSSRRRRIATWMGLMVVSACVALFVVWRGGDAGSAGDPQAHVAGEISWGPVRTRKVASDEYAIDAQVLHNELVGAAARPGSPYVLFQLDEGRFDETEYVDTTFAEKALGMSHDQTLTISATPGPNVDANEAPQGRLSPSVDGRIHYHDIPSGTYELRAMVVRPDGTWNGTVASRTVTVE